MRRKINFVPFAEPDLLLDGRVLSESWSWRLLSKVYWVLADDADGDAVNYIVRRRGFRLVGFEFDVDHSVG